MTVLCVAAIWWNFEWKVSFRSAQLSGRFSTEAACADHRSAVVAPYSSRGKWRAVVFQLTPWHKAEIYTEPKPKTYVELKPKVPEKEPKGETYREDPSDPWGPN